MMQGEGDGAGTIITRVAEGSVSAAPMIGFCADGVDGPYRRLHAVGSVRGGVGDSVAQNSSIAVNDGTGTTGPHWGDGRCPFVFFHLRGARNSARRVVGHVDPRAGSGSDSIKTE